ncbi:ribosomal RNA processing protein-like protein [Striga asiatica]|uniref:Ribosomal RNA processing protein-like protein n=1 Tax=Striga asiatica TaxID=4170 RepID=A0A5A7P503_STRAF|nr:ribosomal RNA processing protein-like protein [Striga asiatica]
MKKRPREPKHLAPLLASTTGPALIKHLASCNTSVRSQALRRLQSWLVSQTQQLSEPDIKKLWKGLFYCLWHADKTPNQVALIDRLTTLFLSLQPSLSLEFFRGFLVTLRREWPGIDRLRLDKFYLLIRRFMRTLFELMRMSKWDLGILGEYFRVLERDGFLAEDKLQGSGVNYHVASVFLDELKGVGFPVRKEVVDVVFGPFFAAMKSSKDRVLLRKVKSCLFDELLRIGEEVLTKKNMGEDLNDKDGDVLLGLVALKMGFSGRFYEVGSSTDCIQGNRKVLLGLYEEFLKLEKDLESSGVEIGIPEYNNEDGGDEVPQLVPIDFDGVNGNVEMKTEAVAEEIGKKKNIKKTKKGADGGEKKKKKKKRKVDNGVLEINSAVKENNVSAGTNVGENLRLDTDSENGVKDAVEIDGSEPALDENVILNLQKQFEKVAAEMDSKFDENSDFSVTPLVPMKRSKRKKTEFVRKPESSNPKKNKNGDNEADAAGKSVDKSSKKVRFSMKNNLVWKPQNPLPPESLRLPPSVTPRGSALKKGVPPGPIIELPSVLKKTKKKRVQNKGKSATPVIRKRRKMQTQSA